MTSYEESESESESGRNLGREREGGQGSCSAGIGCSVAGSDVISFWMTGGVTMMGSSVRLEKEVTEDKIGEGGSGEVEGEVGFFIRRS